jgi:hypothetical protein
VEGAFRPEPQGIPPAEPRRARAKVSPKSWEWVKTQAIGCCYPVGENRKRSKSHLTHASPARQQGTRVPPRKGPYEAGGSAKAGRVIEPRNWYSRGHQDIPQGCIEGKADGVHALEGSSPGCGMASAQDTTGVGERGMSSEG